MRIFLKEIWSKNSQKILFHGNVIFRNQTKYEELTFSNLKFLGNYKFILYQTLHNTQNINYIVGSSIQIF